MATLASIASALTLGLPYWVVSMLVLGFLVVCIVLILTVLIQKPQGGGLSGAFGAGGGGSGQTAFGAKTGDALTIATITMFVVFLGFAIGLNFAARPANIDGSGPPTVSPLTEDGATGPDGEPVDLGEDGEPVVGNAGAEAGDAIDELIENATNAAEDAAADGAAAVDDAVDAGGDAMDDAVDDVLNTEMPEQP